MNTTDWIGFIGVGFLLIAYMFHVLKIIEATHISYLLLNLVGAAMACIASYLLKYWPFIILEAVWTMVSFIALVKRLNRINISHSA